MSISSTVTTGWSEAANIPPLTPLHAGIFVYGDNPYHGEQLAAASFSIGGKEYKDVIPYFTIGKLFPERESEPCRFDLVGTQAATHT